MGRVATLRDGSRITLYSAHYVKERLEEACGTLQRLPMPRHGRPREFGNYWPDTILDFWAMWNALDQDEKNEREKDLNRTKIWATPQQITEMDEALTWLNYILDPRHRRIVFARALGIRPFKLTKECGVHRNTITNWCESGVARITTSLNACADCANNL